MTKHICSCGRPISKPFNSTIYPKICPSCERIQKNKALLAQSFMSRQKAPKTGLRCVKKKTPRQRAMERADKWFSRYIRLKYSFEQNGELFCRCYTCGRVHGIKEITLGHWQRRGYKTTRFNGNNGRAQCIQCNYYHSGMPEIFEQNLVKEIGQDKVNELKSLAMEDGQDNELFYREQATRYRGLFKQLLEERGIKDPWK